MYKSVLAEERAFYEAIASMYHRTCELVGFCDVSQTRMDYANRVLVNKYGQKKVKTCMPSQFEQLLDDVRPDEVIITSVDRTHHDYIIRAMRKGYDVICEKPLTIDEEKAQEIITVQNKREGICESLSIIVMRHITLR